MEFQVKILTYLFEDKVIGITKRTRIIEVNYNSCTSFQHNNNLTELDPHLQCCSHEFNFRGTS